MIPIAILNLKGGVGKTTLTVNLGASISKLGNRVLLMDMDPQNDLSKFLGTNPLNEKGIEFLLTGDFDFNSILKTYNENLFYLPSGRRLKDLEQNLKFCLKKETNYWYSLLKSSFLNFNSEFDYLLIDCPPNIGLLNINVLNYVTYVIIPTQCHYLGLDRLKNTIMFIKKIKMFQNDRLKILAIVPVMYDGRTKIAQLSMQKLKKVYKKYVTNSYINTNVSLAEAPIHNKTVLDYRPKSRGAKDFNNLAEEITQKFSDII
jgi:chromosome partitioning protein